MPSIRSHARRLLSFALLSAGLTAQAAAATGGWADTDTVSLASFPGIADLGPAASDTPMKLMVSLKLRNTSVLYGHLQHLMTPGDALYGHYLRPEDFAASYSPTMSEASAVINYLHFVGFTNITLSPNRTVIRMDGTPALAAKAFNTSIHRVTLNGKEVLANLEAAQIPAQFSSTVLSIAGLNTIQTKFVNPRPQAPSINSLSGYYAPQFQTAYDVDPAVDGSTVSIAIIAEGDLSKVLPGDLRAYEDDPKNNLPHVPYTVIQTGFDHSDASGADEFDLDTQTSTGIAGNVKMLYVYDGSALNDIELIDEINHYVTDDLAIAASESIGGCESTTYAFGELSAYDQVFIQMATQGQSFFSSTGDSGAACLNPVGNGVPAGVPGVEFPASSTYVVGVGGTTLLVNDDNTYSTEVAWYSGGGGTSVFEKGGSWQAAVVPGAATGFKGVPDISMDADANTPAEVYVGGTAEGVGGTSLSSPLALGSWARIQAANGGKLGFAPPVLYSTSTALLTAAPGYHDVIVGNNAGYSATPGWDYTTGIGTFDIKAISGLVKPVAVALPPVTPLGGNSCVLPGDLLAVGATDGETDALTSHNVLKLYIAEPDPATTGNVDSFVFTLTAQDLSTIPPATAYIVYFVLPDGNEYYVAYESTTDPAATSAFTYGKIVVTQTGGNPLTPGGLLINFIPIQQGYTAAGSNLDVAGNKIVWVLPKNLIATYTEDQKLYQIYGEADVEATPIADNMGETTTVASNQVVDDTPQGNYTPIGNAACVAATGTTTGSSTGGTTGGSTTGSSTGGTTGGSSTGGTTAGGTSGGSSTGGTTGGTSGGTSTGGTSSGSSTGGTSGGGTSGSSTGGSGGGGTSGSSTGGSSGGGTSGSSTGGATGGSTGGATGGSTGASSTGGTSTGGSTVTTSAAGDRLGGGAFGASMLAWFALAAWRRRRRAAIRH